MKTAAFLIALAMFAPTNADDSDRPRGGRSAAAAVCFTQMAGVNFLQQQGDCLGGVTSLISELETEVIGEGDAVNKVYAEASEFCEDKSKELQFEIKTGKAESEELTATIEDMSSKISSLTAKIEDLGASVAGQDGDLKAATKIRTEEAADFAAEEKELNGVISSLQRAVGILERELAKSGASMLQMKNVGSLVEAFSVMVKPAGLSQADAKTLSSFVQSSQEDEEPGAPAAAVYEGSSGNIVETLQGLLDKATSQLDAARKAETTAVNNFELLKQSLDDAMKNAKDDMEKAKKAMAEAGETKSVAQGDLTVTTKDLNEDTADLEGLHHNCMAKAEDYEAEVKAREDELKALASAKKILKESTEAFVQQSYSLLQISNKKSGLQGRDSHAVKFVRDIAIKQNSKSLAQLAQRMQSAFRFGAVAGEDPFAKVKGLITDMIAKLEQAAEDDATQKSWCDKEMRETTEKKEDKDGEIEALSTKIDQMSSNSAKLNEQVAVLQKELAELAASQEEMDKIRAEEKALYGTNQPATKKALAGIKSALAVLTEQYAGKDSGAASSILGLLEVCESDFSKGLAGIEATEASAVDAYEAQTKENEVTKTAKDQDVKYKTKEATGLDKAVAESSSDREGVQAELDAVMEYFGKIKDKCIAKPETYEQQKARREAEIAGCKEALSILEGEAALLQYRSARRTLRGVRRHA